VTFTSANPADANDFNPYTASISVTDAIGGPDTCFSQTIPIEDDHLIESSEQFTIMISGVDCNGGTIGCTVGAMDTATVDITDNDTPPGTKYRLLLIYSKWCEIIFTF